MPGTRITTISALALFTGSLIAAAPDYFPLQVGNSWQYTGGNGIQVTGTKDVNGRTYYTVDAFGRTSLIRKTSNGNLVAYNRERRAEEPWLSFTAAGKKTFPTKLDQCTKAGHIESRHEKVSSPSGHFDNVLHIKFEPSCADAGITDAWFQPKVGMVRYAITTFAGARTFDLVSSNAGPVSTNLQLVSKSYKPGDTLQATLSLRNTSNRPVVLNFPSGQRYDLAIKDAKGNVVTTWSHDRMFTQEYASESLAPGAEKTFTVSLDLRDLTPGRYTAQAWLTTDKTAPKAYSASAAFDVVAAK